MTSVGAERLTWVEILVGIASLVVVIVGLGVWRYVHSASAGFSALPGGSDRSSAPDFECGLESTVMQR